MRTANNSTTHARGSEYHPRPPVPGAPAERHTGCAQQTTARQTRRFRNTGRNDFQFRRKNTSRNGIISDCILPTGYCPAGGPSLPHDSAAGTLRLPAVQRGTAILPYPSSQSAALFARPLLILFQLVVQHGLVKVDVSATGTGDKRCGCLVLSLCILDIGFRRHPVLVAFGGLPQQQVR